MKRKRDTEEKKEDIKSPKKRKIEGKKYTYYCLGSVLSAILNHAFSDNKNEIIGLLGGTVDHEKEEVIITHTYSAVRDLKEIGEFAVATTSDEQIKSLQYFSGNQVTNVGWYHSHPNLRPTPSITDINMQKQYQQYGNHIVGIICTPYIIISDTEVETMFNFFQVVERSDDEVLALHQQQILKQQQQTNKNQKTSITIDLENDSEEVSTTTTTNAAGNRIINRDKVISVDYEILEEEMMSHTSLAEIQRNLLTVLNETKAEKDDLWKKNENLRRKYFIVSEYHSFLDKFYKESVLRNRVHVMNDIKKISMNTIEMREKIKRILSSVEDKTKFLSFSQFREKIMNPQKTKKEEEEEENIKTVTDEGCDYVFKNSLTFLRERQEEQKKRMKHVDNNNNNNNSFRPTSGNILTSINSPSQKRNLKEYVGNLAPIHTLDLENNTMSTRYTGDTTPFSVNRSQLPSFQQNMNYQQQMKRNRRKGGRGTPPIPPSSHFSSSSYSSLVERSPLPDLSKNSKNIGVATTASSTPATSTPVTATSQREKFNSLDGYDFIFPGEKKEQEQSSSTTTTPASSASLPSTLNLPTHISQDDPEIKALDKELEGFLSKIKKENPQGKNQKLEGLVIPPPPLPLNNNNNQQPPQQQQQVGKKDDEEEGGEEEVKTPMTTTQYNTIPETPMFHIYHGNEMLKEKVEEQPKQEQEQPKKEEKVEDWERIYTVKKDDIIGRKRDKLMFRKVFVKTKASLEDGMKMMIDEDQEYKEFEFNKDDDVEYLSEGIRREGKVQAFLYRLGEGEDIGPDIEKFDVVVKKNELASGVDFTDLKLLVKIKDCSGTRIEEPLFVPVTSIINSKM